MITKENLSLREAAKAFGLNTAQPFMRKRPGYACSFTAVPVCSGMDIPHVR